MAERERFTTTIDGHLLEEIKILAIRERCDTNNLLEEAISDLLRKYEERKKRREKSDQLKIDVVAGSDRS